MKCFRFCAMLVGMMFFLSWLLSRRSSDGRSGSGSQSIEVSMTSMTGHAKNFWLKLIDFVISILYSINSHFSHLILSFHTLDTFRMPNTCFSDSFWAPFSVLGEYEKSESSSWRVCQNAQDQSSYYRRSILITCLNTCSLSQRVVTLGGSQHAIAVGNRKLKIWL